MPDTSKIGSDNDVMDKNGMNKKSSLMIILIYNVILILVAAIFYYLIPILLNYFPDKDEVLTRLNAIKYLPQYIIVFSFAIILSSILLLRLFKGINGWEKLLHDSQEKRTAGIARIRRKCLNLPYLIYIAQVLILSVLAAIFLTVNTAKNDTSFVFIPKLLIVLFSILCLAGILSLIFSKNIFTQILIKTYDGQGLEGLRISLRTKIFLQIMPMLTVAILITALLGYSRLVEEKADLIYKSYKNELIAQFSDLKHGGLQEFRDRIKGIKLENSMDSTFIITPESEIVTSDGKELGKVFLIYATDLSRKHDGHVFSDEGETHGAVIRVNNESGEWIVGVKFVVVSNEAVMFFFFSFLALLLVNFFVLYYFSKALSGEISLVAEGLTEIAEGEHVDLDKKLAVISNDELGDLVIAFNKIQEKEKEYIAQREEQQSILMEQERLASLGQLIGGIAHNLRTPIMSLSGAIEGLKDLVKEYDMSIDDSQVTKEDHHQIAKDMAEWLEKMKPHCAYMSEIITAVKEQTVQSTTDKGLYFTIDEIAKRVDILMNHELKKFRCKLHTEFNVDMNTRISGEVSLLVQVLNNLIINAIDSYEGKGGDIDFKISQKEDKVEFIIKDYGKGIPEEIKDKLFREMITTKGKKGTGLGLYMSYSNIKVRFKGKMKFESEEGKGTTFHITIPTA